MGSDILILEEPTNGVDVGSKAETDVIMNMALKEGKAILRGLLRLRGSRVHVPPGARLQPRQTVAEITREQLTVERVTHVASGFTGSLARSKESMDMEPRETAGMGLRDNLLRFVSQYGLPGRSSWQLPFFLFSFPARFQPRSISGPS